MKPPTWFLEAYIAFARPASNVRPELYRAADELAAQRLWDEVEPRMVSRGTPIWERFPFVHDASSNTPGIRAQRWSNRKVLYSPDEQAEILKKFPELEQP